jgi:outer membrane protein TolC
MVHHRRPSGRRPVRAAENFLLVLLVSLVAILPGTAVQPPAEALPAPGESAPTAPAAAAHAPLVLDLPSALSLALGHQPRIAAARASLAASQDGQRALCSLHVPDAIAHQLPIRRQQAALGVTASVAGVAGAEYEAVYAVTRTYYTVLYAREQEKLARGVVERLSAIHDSAKRMLDAGARNVTSSDVGKSLVYLRLAEAKRVQASEGVQRALAALKEAIGLEPGVCIDVPEAPLPVPEVKPCRGDVIALALARRSELIQANIFVEVVGLEADAQATSHHLRMETFASGSDLHAHTVPPGIHNTEYRPGGIPPEMPYSLAGSRCERVQHTRDLQGRAVAVVEATRNLIVLEADNAFLQWEQASQQVPLAREAADAAEKVANDLNKDFTAGLNVKVEDVTNARVLAAQARSQYNDYLYRMILELADLERITAGGFCAGLAGAAGPPPPPAKGK